MLTTLLTLLAATVPLPAQEAPQTRPIGVETQISFAANGGIRDWRRGPEDSNIVYLQARNLRWYEVTLTGPCLDNTSFEPMIYTTGPGGALDRFSRISSARNPDLVCGVESIKTSLPPEQMRADG